MLSAVYSGRGAGAGRVSLFPRAGIAAGHRGHHGGQAPHHAGLEQLSGPHDEFIRDRGGRTGLPDARLRLLRLPLSQRDAEAPSGAGG